MTVGRLDVAGLSAFTTSFYSSANALKAGVFAVASQIEGAIRITLRMSADPTDEELLSDASAAGFALLYGRRYPLVRGYLRRRIGPRSELVLDLVAETFARALERRVLDEEPYAAIAAKIGCSEQVVRKRVSRGLQTLRRASRQGA